ncbi:Gp15 family bacteriophage protein [Anaerofustis stercorihominis]|uniref:Gp15 family bacteriophage protein n=1 Tax=Anaerofustis stercorihominis TaxID=214853 RepID=UPI0039918420
MNFLYSTFPDYTLVNGKKYKIVTDFRNYIQMTSILREKELTYQEKWSFIINKFYKETPHGDIESIIEGLIAFFTMDTDYFEKGKELIIDENEDNKEVISYEQDANIIIVSFLQCYNIDLTDIDYLHWWKFLLLLMNIDNKSPIGNIMSIRGTSLSSIKDKDEKKRIRQLQNIYKIKRQP